MITATKKQTAVLDTQLIAESRDLLLILHNQHSRQILSFLRDFPGATVTTLYQKLGWEQSVASQHLANLRKIDVVSYNQEGKNRKYWLNEKRLESIEWHLNEIV